MWSRISIPKIPSILFLYSYPSLVACLLTTSLQAAEKTIRVPDQLADCPAQFIREGICTSKGDIWVVSEQSGIYRLPLSSSYNRWENLHSYQGLPDTKHYTCIAEDKQHRIWAGTHNKGVSIFNGEEWKNYDRTNALPGDHIFDLAVSPVSGDVAIASSGGVTIYNPVTDTWQDLNRATGLIENQVESLTFDAQGNLWLAYACGGVSMSNPKQQYSIQTTVQTKWYWDAFQLQRYPTKASGYGLPSNFCNYIYSAQNGKIFVCTTSGLGFIGNSGAWQFIRGADYEDKNAGTYIKGKKSDNQTPKNINSNKKERLLPEDYLTSFSESEDGYWLGTREYGAALLHKKTLKVIKRFESNTQGNKKAKWISSIIPLPDGSVITTSYGGGVSMLSHGIKEFKISITLAEAPFPSFPETRTATMQEETKYQMVESGLTPSAPNGPLAYFWNEDWSTLGDWCEKHGRDQAILCAMVQGGDMVYSINDQIKVEGNVGGDGRTRGDELRHWVHWPYINLDGNRNVLFCPSICLRRESEWDDHGEAYSKKMDGPDVWAIVDVPEGAYEISLYFYNPNGYNPSESMRDFFIELRKYDEFPISIYKILGKMTFRKTIAHIKNTLSSQIQKLPVLARSRVRFFTAGGVYKTFAIHAPGRYYFRICRNNSFNTILNGIFISQLSRNKRKEDEILKSFIHYAYIPPAPEKLNEAQQQNNYYRLSNKINNSLDQRQSPHTMDLISQMKLLNFRFAKAADTDEHILQHLRWDLKIQDPQDVSYFDQAVRNCWDHLQLYQLPFRSKEWAPKSPNVIPFSIKEIQTMELMGIDWRDFKPSNSPTKEHINNTKEKIKKYIKENGHK